MKKLLNYIIPPITLLITQGYCFADKFGNSLSKIDDGLKGSNETADVAAQTYLGRVLNFIYLLAVIWGIYGGFLILTAGGDDEKVAKGKNVIKEALIGIIIIFLANSLIKFLIEGILKK